MYTTFSNTFISETEGDKKFYFTVRNLTGEITYDGKINDDKKVPKFKMKKDTEGQWKIEGEKIPTWVFGLEGVFHDRIEESRS